MPSSCLWLTNEGQGWSSLSAGCKLLPSLSSAVSPGPPFTGLKHTGMQGQQRGLLEPQCMAMAAWSTGLKRILGLERECGDGLAMSATGMGGGAWALLEEAGSAPHHPGDHL